MPVRQQGDLKIWQRRTRMRQWLNWGAWLFAIALFTYCWQLVSDKTVWMFVWDSPAQASDMASRMVPPKWEYMDELWRPVWDTINIATLGTLMALVMAFPVAFLAARNTTPSVRFVRPVALFIIVSSRSINSLLW
ncbi:MAG: phosphonate ABC transporter, permease protein PhnE, partial [bacterium]|nr:phosphonate ABC transporter, permease protein PhnE [bacterium]